MSGKHSPTGDRSHPQRASEAPDALREEVEHLQEAIKSQRDIGMAIGLLSARYGCSTEQAWRTMLRVSQDSNTKIRTVARVLVNTHDGSADDDERRALASFVAHLPASGWPEGPRTEQDLSP